MAKSVLQLRNVSKYYYSETTVTQALRKINLEFQMGEFVAITGESGGGKSTLLNIISGLDTFDEGEMYFKDEPTFQFDGQDWEEYRRNQIGFIFQDYSLIGHYTTLDNVLSALVIQEREPEQAKQLALDYLEQVGLGEFADQRASQLSSGQKQRLAIARALAKDTDIIVADEPTGNLDSETGVQVIQILKKLSREKLVIMVTHNYDQAEPYVTRKIRLHDGAVVTDVLVGKERGAESSFGEDTSQQEKTIENERVKANASEKSKPYGTNRMASFFALKNIRMQRGRTALFFSFFFITAVVSFLFIGELLVFGDDRITKEYDSSAYLQENDTRVVVRYPDNRELTNKDQDKILSVKHVEEVDLYDYANDVRYYYQEGKGYKYSYGVREKDGDGEHAEAAEDTGKEIRDVQLLTKEQYVKSAACLSESKLSAGHLPEGRNEIVLYSKDKNILGTEQECYFTADNIWKSEETYHTKVKVVGLLKEKTDQIYFDYRLCQMLTVGMDKEFRLDYCWDKRRKCYVGEMDFFPVIGEGLEEKEIRISSNYIVPGSGIQVLPTDLRSAFAGNSLLHVMERGDMGGLTEQSAMLMWEDEPKHLEARNGIEVEVEGIEVKVQLEEFTDQGGDIVEMSEELFNRLYQPKTTQASVYISSYAKTDKVIDALNQAGYDAISTYRVSSINYIEAKVYQRLEVIAISSAVLLALMVLQILLVRSVLKIKIKDYYVLKFMGMRMRQLERITYLEMGIHCIMAVVIALLLMAGLCVGKVSFIVNMIQYYTVPGVFLFVVYNIVLMVLTVLFFHRLLRKRVKGEKNH